MDGEEMADNVQDEEFENDLEGLFNEPVEEPASPAEETKSSEDVTTTQAFSKRLKEETTKIKQEVRDEERKNIAESFGYDNWDEFVKTQTDNKMLDKGFDPEEVRPLFESFKKNDPEYQEAMKYKKEKEELEQQIWAQNCLKDLNSKFGTTFTDIKQLDEGTIDLWNQGVSLDKAYAANNYEKLTHKQEVKQPQLKGTEHMTQTSSSAAATAPDKVSNEEMRIYKMLMPNASEQDILTFKNAQKK